MGPAWQRKAIYQKRRPRDAEGQRPRASRRITSRSQTGYALPASGRTSGGITGRDRGDHRAQVRPRNEGLPAREQSGTSSARGKSRQRERLGQGTASEGSIPSVRETIILIGKQIRSRRVEQTGGNSPRSQHQKSRSRPGFGHCDELADTRCLVRGTAKRVRRRANRHIPRRRPGTRRRDKRDHGPP